MAAAVGVKSWRAVFSFASRDGVNWLLEDSVINQLVDGEAQIEFTVGLDAITNRQTLERLLEFDQLHMNFRSRVFWNDFSSLFHPKICDFLYPDGSRTLIVGSGNLTPGGLMNNVEGYVVISAEHDEVIDVSDLDEFLSRHQESVRMIDNHALERAGQNVIQRTTGTQQDSGITLKTPLKISEPEQVIPGLGNNRTSTTDRILIAQVPRAGGRWSQVHFNSEIVSQYFRISNVGNQRVYLTHVHDNGTCADVEVRPCVYSLSNRNHKIEFGAASGREYPETPPLLVLRERLLRVFDYMLLVPGHEGYDKLLELSNTLPSVGRGFPRVITSLDKLSEAWSECPLVDFHKGENHFF